MLVLRALGRDGEVPLLGPTTFDRRRSTTAPSTTSCSPRRRSSPTSTRSRRRSTHRARSGIAAVAAIVGLGRAGRRPAGRAPSRGSSPRSRPRSSTSSTFIWNPNPIPARRGARVLGAVLRAGRAGRRAGGSWPAPARWSRCSSTCWAGCSSRRSSSAWVARPGRATGRGRARPSCGARGGSARSRSSRPGYLPLLVSRARRRLRGRDTRAPRLPRRGRARARAGRSAALSSVAFRSITWPFAGVDHGGADCSRSSSPLIAVVLLGDRGPLARDDRTRPGSLLAGSAWSCGRVPALALLGARASLTAIPGLPNDHYHIPRPARSRPVAASGSRAIAGLGGRTPSAGRRATAGPGAARGGSLARGPRRARRDRRLALAGRDVAGRSAGPSPTRPPRG